MGALTQVGMLLIEAAQFEQRARECQARAAELLVEQGCPATPSTLSAAARALRCDPRMNSLLVGRVVAERVRRSLRPSPAPVTFGLRRCRADRLARACFRVSIRRSMARGGR